jgi:glycosyltransferase involved in cell wall biosynthesis
MRIALTTYALHVGGLETFIFSLARGLVRAGHEVHIVATDERGAWYGRAFQAGLQVHFVDGGARKSRATRARGVGRFLASNEFDAVINNFSWSVQASFGMLPAKTVTISVIHNSAEAVISLSCANVPACQAFVAPSPATVDLARSRVPPEKVHLVQHGVEILESPPQPKSHSELRVVFCGRLDHTQKGILQLPEIIRRVCDSGVGIRLEVIGEGPDRERLARLIHEVGVAHHVEILGALDHEQSLQRIRQADAVILPSLFEGLPLVPLEAMANGSVPVVSSLPGITDWIVGDAVSGFLVPPRDVTRYGDVLIRLGRDPGLRRRMSLAAWETARDRFSVTTMVVRYLDLLERLRRQPQRRTSLPALAPDVVHWKDRIPDPLRHALGRLRRQA